MTLLTNSLQAVKTRMQLAAARAGRPADAIQLLAVSKTFPAEAVRGLAQQGVSAFGENYVQEALEKMDALPDLALDWHFIGPIQSNKTRLIATRFAWVHSVDRAKIADRLNAARAEAQLPPLQVLIQVNISGEASKQGAAPADVLPLARHIQSLPHLCLRGLMAIPEPTEDPALRHARFREMKALLEALNREGLPLEALSMGMSDDFEVAIEEGATIIRVGSALFGHRPRKIKEV
jgi:PLP dependent protein